MKQDEPQSRSEQPSLIEQLRSLAKSDPNTIAFAGQAQMLMKWAADTIEAGTAAVRSEQQYNRLLDELIARDDRLETMVRKAVDTGDLDELRGWLKIRVGVRFITDTRLGGV